MSGTNRKKPKRDKKDKKDEESASQVFYGSQSSQGAGPSALSALDDSKDFARCFPIALRQSYGSVVTTFNDHSRVSVPFHFRIGNTVLHIEPAYQQVAPVIINWSQSEVADLLRGLSKRGISSGPAEKNRLSVFCFHLVGPAAGWDYFAENQWIHGPLPDCNKCQQWQHTLPSEFPSDNVQHDLLNQSRDMASSGWGFAAIPWGAAVFAWDNQALEQGE
ncbi:hypothetical protein F5Y15DRAFT_422080 [Xylariaceae sp. FL0016]|nr:hypothetical protein F5Y15DRAFT_422080 [Xylariaceae sp. FL0016]